MANQAASAQTIAVLLPKLSHPDKDFRFMALNDIYNVLATGPSHILSNDYRVAAHTFEGLVKSLDDTNGEVQNLAIKCLGPFTQKIPNAILMPLLDRLASLQTHNAVDKTVSSTALRTVVTSLPRSSAPTKSRDNAGDAYLAIHAVLIPRLVGRPITARWPGSEIRPPGSGGLLDSSTGKALEADMLDVLIEVVRCFGSRLSQSEVRELQLTVMSILQNERVSSVVSKRAVVAMSVLAAYFSGQHMSEFISYLIESFRNSHLTPSKRRLLINIIGSLARTTSAKFGPHLKTMAPFVLSALSAEELAEQMERATEDGEQNLPNDEVREAALVAVEGFMAHCSADMRSYTDDCINAAIRYLSYDPNITEEIDDDDNDGDSDMRSDNEADEDDGDDDFEEEEGFNDDDDLSWKLRRCAAKLIHTIVSTRAADDLLADGTIYDRIAPVLVDRFKEREENVRLEILLTMSSLIRQTGGEFPSLSSSSDDDVPTSPVDAPQSRKRRRGGSDASMFDTQARISLSAGLTSPTLPTIPTWGPQASLVALNPAIVRASQRLLRLKSIPTTQATIVLLRDLIQVQHGGLAEHLHQIFDPVIDAITSPSAASGLNGGVSGGTSATGSSLRLEALTLVAAIVETHPSSVLQAHLAKLIPAVVLAVEDRYFKISGQAIFVVEQLVKVLTPPRMNTVTDQQQDQLSHLLRVVLMRVSANDADLEVRQRGIHCLGVLLGRCAGPDAHRLLAPAQRQEALELLNERLHNELTRSAAVKAIDTVVTLVRDGNEFENLVGWPRDVALELGAQLRKADRSLRGASLAALKNLVANPVCRAHLDEKTVGALVDLLYPLLTPHDLHLLGPALVVLADLVSGNAKMAINNDVTDSLTALVLAPLTGGVLDALLILVRTIGGEGAGGRLMKGMLKDVGVNGDPAVVGKVIGTLLVSGGDSVGVKLSDFGGELQTTKDDRRKCLALSVLGEAAHRMGSASPLQPDVFTDHFRSGSDRVSLAAAVALGRAGAGNIETYLPLALSMMDRNATTQYLLLHSIKEILQCVGADEASIGEHSEEIWDQLLVATQTEDNRAIGAECIGRLAIVEPMVYLPKLQTLLRDADPIVRGMIIQALRYTLADTADSFDALLKPVLVSMLTTMLHDDDLENRRLAMTTLNSAAHNKPTLIKPQLGQLLPLVMKESRVKAELIREVQMGPFKHKVDDGLEVRKSAYETLYALMETAFPLIPTPDLFDRVIAGLEDEHDIRVLCNLMLTKLIVLDHNETGRHLDLIAERFRTILSFQPKESAVKQELEKVEAASKGVLRVSVLLERMVVKEGRVMGTSITGDKMVWKAYWDWVRKDFAEAIKRVNEEMGDRMEY